MFPLFTQTLDPYFPVWFNCLIFITMGVSSDLICAVRNSGFHQILVSRVKPALKFGSEVFNFNYIFSRIIKDWVFS
ncbi:hypothetical protein C5167_030604 [Papaver somniferum]|nr:hypothetical protein C5167_030604 [Papaver somniferum]